MMEYRIVKQSSILSAFLWMLFISILLFWLPVIGPFIGGFVGGKKAGNIGRAFMASLLPALIVSIILIIFSGSFLIPPLAAALGVAVVLVYITQVFTLIAGAVVGGALA